MLSPFNPEVDPSVIRTKAKTGTLPFSYDRISILFLICDALSIVAVSVLSGVLYHLATFETFGDVVKFFAAGCMVAALFVATLSARKLYDPAKLVGERASISGVMLSWTVVFSFLAFVGFTLKVSEDFSRGSMLVFFLLGASVLVITRSAGGRALRRALTAGALRGRRVVLLYDREEYSSGDLSQSLADQGYRILNFFPLQPKDDGEGGLDEENCKVVRDLLSYVRREQPDEILLVVNWGDFGRLERLLAMLRTRPVPVKLLADQRMRNILRRPLSDIGSTVAVEMQRAPLTRLERSLKRGLDLVCAVSGLALLSPLLLCVALLIKLDSRGPVFFRQSRTGFDGKIFRIYKFRSMRMAQEGSSVKQASRNDHRVTAVGRVLRKTSIDELPQLLNVISGEMSLVGPRPHAVAHDNEYDPLIADYALRHKVKPGITGWAQVNGLRGETNTVEDMRRRVEYDLWYVDNWSIWLDLRTIGATVIKVVKGDDAY